MTKDEAILELGGIPAGFALSDKEKKALSLAISALEFNEKLAEALQQIDVKLSQLVIPNGFEREIREICLNVLAQTERGKG